MEEEGVAERVVVVVAEFLLNEVRLTSAKLAFEGEKMYRCFRSRQA